MRDQNKYACTDHVNFSDIKDVKFELKTTKEVLIKNNSKSRVCHIKTPKFAESTKTKVRYGKIFTKSRVKEINSNGKLCDKYSNQVKMNTETPCNTPKVTQNLSRPTKILTQRIRVPKKPPPKRDNYEMGHIWDQAIPFKGALDLSFVYTHTRVGA